MSDGTYKNVSIVWNPSNVDTSKTGTYIFTGIVANFPNHVILTLIVKAKVVSLISYNLGEIAFQNMPCTLPQTVTANMSDGSKAEVPITWSPSTVDLTNTGEYDFTGTVEGLSNKVNYTLWVYSPIVSIRSISASVFQNDPYSLPSSVMAVINNGSTVLPCDVVWTPSTVDTSKIGVYTFEGTIKNYTGKGVLTLTVKSRISFNDIQTTVNQNDPYILPQTVTGYVCDGTTKEMPITWNATSVDTSSGGLQTFEGTVEGYEGKIKLSLFVRAPGLVYIPDPKLEAAIRSAITKPTGDILESDMLNINVLDIKYLGIVSLEGIQYAKNLTMLYLTSNKIEDISQLKDLTQLKYLYLNDNKIKSIASLSNLTKLLIISLGDNSITDISPVSNLTSLVSLDVTRNPINDISSLQNLKGNLEYLTLHSCGISDISVLSNFTNLLSLGINYNYIEDITPLSGLVNLTYLDLSNNLIEDFTPLTTLSNLTELDLSGNNIRDYSNYNLFNDSIQINFWGLMQTKTDIAALMSKADEIIASVTRPDMTPYEKEKALHDYICTHTIYTLGINEGAYGILIEGKGSCDAYADTMNLLLNRIGIYCIKIHGLCGSEAHAWNIVMIDGKYYHLDTTWDGYYTEQNGGTICYTYLNVNDAFMLTERTWDRSKYPACE